MPAHHGHPEFLAAVTDPLHHQGSSRFFAVGQHIDQSDRTAAHGIDIVDRHHDGGLAGGVGLLHQELGHDPVRRQKQESVPPGDHGGVVPKVGQLGPVRGAGHQFFKDRFNRLFAEQSGIFFDFRTKIDDFLGRTGDRHGSYLDWRAGSDSLSTCESIERNQDMVVYALG